MLQIVQARDDLLSKLGIENATLAQTLALQDVMVAINGAMQLLQTAGQDYFTREIITIPLSAGTSIYNISSTVQSVLGPVRWNNVKPLRGLTSEGELDQFDRIFNGGSGYGIGADGDPVAYFVKYLRNGTVGDICGISFRLAPAPSSPAGILYAEVVNDAPSYTVADLTSTNVLPVAQNYTESIFLPIARLLITRSSQFSRPDLLTQLEQDGQRALQALGLSGGFPNVDVPAPERKTEG
jgi:hypothetical protein